MAEDACACSPLPRPALPSTIPTADSTSNVHSVQMPVIDSTEPPAPVSDSASVSQFVPSVALTGIDSEWQSEDSASTSPVLPLGDSSGDDDSSMSMQSEASMADHRDGGPVLPKTFSSNVNPAAQTSFCPFNRRFFSFDTLQKQMAVETLFDEPSIFHRFQWKKDADITKKRMSKYVHTQPLYQVYWSQRTEQDSTDGVVGFRVDMSLSLAGLFSSSILSPPQMSPRDSAFSFWQEIPQVKESGLLKTISHKERLLQEAVFEVVTSEASYQRSLSVAVNHFQKSYKLAKSMHTTDAHALFSNLQQVKDVSKRFLLEMEESLEEDVFLSGIGDLVLKHCPSFHKVYVPYVSNQMFQERLMQHLTQDNLKFVQVLQKLEQQAVCQRQSLKSFLVLPFQRITRLKILLESILKRSVLGSLMAQSVERALKAVSQIVSECNARVGRMKQIEELVHLEKRVQFLTTKSFPLISQDRWILRHGALTEILWHETCLGHKPRISSRPVYLHLFSDMLLKSRTENDQFLVEDYATLYNVEAKLFNSKVLGLPSAAFHLCLQRNHAGCSCSFILVAANESEKKQWLTLLSRPTGPDNVMEVGNQAKQEFLENPEEKCKRILEQTADPSLCVEAVAACEQNPSAPFRPVEEMGSVREKEYERTFRVAEPCARNISGRWCSPGNEQSGHLPEAHSSLKETTNYSNLECGL